MVVSFDTSSLLNYYQARQGQAASTGVGATTSSGGAKPKYAPTPPWSTTSGAQRSNDLVKTAM